MDLRLIQRLRGLRTKLRSIYLVAGILRLAAEAMLYLALAFTLDRFLLLPSSVRLVLLVLAGGLLVLRVQRLIVYPLRRPIRIDDMALAVERNHPDLSGQLASAVEFVHRKDALPRDVSPELLERWLGEIEALGAKIPFEDIFQLRRVRQLAGIATALLLLVVGFAFLQPTQSRVFVQRLFGSEIEWPRRTHLSVSIPERSAHYRVLEDENGHPARIQIAKGASLPVLVHAVGVIPDDVILDVRDTHRIGRAEEVRMLPREGQAGVFAYRFRNDLRDMTLKPSGGDDPGTTLEMKIEVSPPPAVERLVATVTPPAYTGLPSVREERQDFQVPIGTQLDLEIYTTVELEAGSLTFHGDPATAEPLQRHPENPTQFLFSFVVEESGSFNLHLTGAAGFKNLVALDYRITAVPDRKPTLEVARPRTSNREVTVRGLVPFQVFADDDYGVTEVALLVARFGEEKPVPLPLYPADGVTLLPESGRLLLRHRLDFLTFRLPHEEGLKSLEEGETVIYKIAALDNRQQPGGGADPNQTLTPTRRIELVSESEKMRKLADRQLRTKAAVRTLRKNQQDKLDELEAVLGSDEGDAGVVLADARDLSALEIDQDRITSRSGQITRDFTELVEEYLLNRLDPSLSAERALAFYLETLAAIDHGMRFEARDYQELLAAHREGKFGQLDFLGNLFDMLDLAMLASEEQAQKALEYLREARVTSDVSRRPVLLAGAAEQERLVLATYDRLLEKMEEWEDFQEILDLMRGLVSDQEDINRRYRDQGD